LLGGAVTENRTNDRAKHGSDEPTKCDKKFCLKFDTKKYLQQLQQFLPPVPPVPKSVLKSLHNTRDFKGMVQLIKRAMNIGDVTFHVFLVAEGAKKEMQDAMAWVELPREMPFFGTNEFKQMTINFFFRKPLLEQSTYDQVAICIAHEMSHVVLDSIRHPLRRCEKAVDLTAMLLGFRVLYRSGQYKEVRSGNKISIRDQGYLTEHEVRLANEILSQNALARRWHGFVRAIKQFFSRIKSRWATRAARQTAASNSIGKRWPASSATRLNLTLIGSSIGLLIFFGVMAFLIIVTPISETRDVLNGVEASELPNKNAIAMAAFRQALPRRFHQEHWIYDMNGVSAPMSTLSIDNKSFARGWICKPRDCNRNQLSFLVAVDGSRAVGLLQRGKESVWIGSPSEVEKRLLVQKKQ
jgi:hypothetical protein